ncbi:hypothetical protein R3P38DRAFT_2779634 [Favolaschia claudopus]|uniref:Secreted protein n=1 Tax=Favolaschia claudopus TaxID=2862362 RepID=A0AAW0BG98_9AGAR
MHMFIRLLALCWDLLWVLISSGTTLRLETANRAVARLRMRRGNKGHKAPTPRTTTEYTHPLRSYTRALMSWGISSLPSSEDGRARGREMCRVTEASLSSFGRAAAIFRRTKDKKMVGDREKTWRRMYGSSQSAVTRPPSKETDNIERRCSCQRQRQHSFFCAAIVFERRNSRWLEWVSCGPLSTAWCLTGSGLSSEVWDRYKCYNYPPTGAMAVKARATPIYVLQAPHPVIRKGSDVDETPQFSTTAIFRSRRLIVAGGTTKSSIFTLFDFLLGTRERVGVFENVESAGSGRRRRRNVGGGARTWVFLSSLDFVY